MSNTNDAFLKQLNENTEYYEFWHDFRRYCEDLEIPNKKYFVNSLPILFKKIKNDAASYSIYESLKKFALEKPNEAIEVFKLIKSKGSLETLDFSASILAGLSQSNTNYNFKNEILLLIKSNDNNEFYSGLNAAYQIVIKDKKEEREFLNKIHEILVKILKKESTSGLDIITRFYNKHLNTFPDAKSIVLQLLKKKNVKIQNEVARSIDAEIRYEDDPKHFQDCLNLLSHTDVQYVGIYNFIIFRLKNTIISQPNVVVEFINLWIVNNKSQLKNISILKELINELHSNHPKIIEKLFIDWLNSNKAFFKITLQFVISDLSSQTAFVGLHKESLKKLSETDSLYIVFMIVGYILDRKYASEMLFNILEVNYKNKRIRNHIASLFVNYMIRNYYSVTDILKNKRKTANKIVTSIIDQIIDVSEHYYKQVSDLEFLNEFEPSDKRMQYYFKQQNNQIQKLMSSSESKKDSFLNMLNNVNVKTGKSFFTKFNGEYSEESEMQNFRSSIEVPRVQFIDEIGQLKLRIIWQNMKRNELPD